MAELEAIKRPIAENVKIYEEKLHAELRSENVFVSSICNYILENRGKQLRPLLVLLAAALHGRIDERTYTGASLVEMIHTASLIHDDVVDEAYVRRGAASVNALWRSRTAVLVGDYIFAKTFYNGMRRNGGDMVNEVTNAVYLICEGELIQTEQSENLQITRDIYLDIIYKKTATLLGACGAIGAISVGATQQQVDTMREFGILLGLAFQIKDDMLDYADPEITGKPACSDIRERKINLPLLYVLENLSAEGEDELLDKLANVREQPDNVEYISALVQANGGIEHAETVMLEYKNKALGLLEQYPDSEIRESLHRFADYVLSRDK